ncbi:uncharacterized protein LOC142162157 [Nicotiana tabacum]|uniref:Uncharacterized protein LOC142162157 n=1 Tax=Nicotiana tabacum TaxID=4097 RepID=A0AC58RPB9_TOBAC
MVEKKMSMTAIHSHKEEENERHNTLDNEIYRKFHRSILIFTILHVSFTMGDTTGVTLPQTASSNGANFDPNHPYFLHSSDALGMSLMNAVFDGKAKNKLGFFDGTCVAPAITTKEYQPWTRCNDMVTSWLLNSLSKDIGDSVIYSKSAREFLDQSRTQIWKIKWSKIGNKSMKNPWMMRDLYSFSWACDVYGQARGNILMLNPLPSIDHAYSLVLQDESQREVYMNPLISSDSSSFRVGNQASYALRNNKQMQSKKIGHTVADCYMIIGFPEDFEFTNAKGNQNQIRSNEVLTWDQTDDATSRASEHMYFDSNAFISLDPLPTPLHINLPNSFKVTVTHTGKAPLMKRPRVFGDTNEGLYLLKPSLKEKTISPSFHNVFNQILVILPFFANMVTDVNLWHVRLGHMPFSSMKNLSFVSLSSNSDCLCDICPKARQTRIPFSLSQNKSKRAFELIHVDTWGPYKEPTYNGFKYFLTSVDDFSRRTWIFLLSTKSNAFTILKNFLSMVEKQFAVKVHKLRTDNAFELGKGSQQAAFLSSQGKIHQTSCVSTPQQNGIVERKHRHLLE